MKTAFIPIPLKKTEQVDWIQPLRSYLKRIYGNYKDFENETVQFNKLRSDITGASKDTTGLDIYYKYYGQLELLDLRMPIDQHGGVNIDFKWFDSLKSSKLVSQHSLAFEKASVTNIFKNLLVYYNLLWKISYIVHQMIYLKIWLKLYKN
ncbi:unnamed protein product [[Candida] boidinii]|nr:unnamed protein product [[Candida] boidinii]